MNKPASKSNPWNELNRKNTARLGIWTAAWVATMAVANFGPLFVWETNSALTLGAIIANFGIGFGMIMANVQHLKGLDEMQQKIQLEAMGLSLGTGVVVGLSYSNLDVTNLILFDAEISHLVILMGLTYLAAVVLGQRRYR